MKINTRVLVEGALCAAMTIVLSYIRLFRMPQGGSVTLENIPLIIFALRRGVKAGVGIGALAGLLEMILDGYVVHPVQAFLDYPLAFAAMGLVAAVPGPQWLAITIATAARLCCHVLSGVIFFASYAPEGQHPLLYSLGYNGSFMTVDVILSIILISFIWDRLPQDNK